MGSRFTYSRWDGTQVGFELDADSVLSEITDDLLYHGDLNNALRRMMQSGFRDRNGERLQGLRELMEKLRRRRSDLLEQHNLGGVYDDIAQELRDIIDQERQALDDHVRQAREAATRGARSWPSPPPASTTWSSTCSRPTWPARSASSRSYEFTSQEASQRFEELLDQLRQQLMQRYVNQMASGMENVTPEQMQRLKDMLAGLNEMLERRERGEDPGFEQFMERFGDFFPENPQSLDELLEVMAQRMAAMQAMLNSMTPEQRAQLQQLMDQLMDDMDLRWQMDQLGQHLRSQFPQMGWDRSYSFQGMDPLGFSEAVDMMQQLGDIDQLENLMRGSTSPGALAEADLDRVRDLLGDDAARSLERLAELARMLEEAGLIENREGRLELTPKGIRRVGQNALSDLFTKLAKDKMGQHQITPHRHRPRAQLREQGLRVRRPLQPRPAPDHPQRHPAAGERHAGAPRRRTTSRSS